MDKDTERIRQTAQRLVGFVIKYCNSIPDNLPMEEVQVLVDTLKAAGFEFSKVVPGKLRGKYRDDQGETGETYAVNGTCPYKVVGNGDDNWLATGWLNDVIVGTISEFRWKDPVEVELIKFVVKEIKRAVPLEPIRITSDGDMLEEYPPSSPSSNLVDHTDDTKSMSSSAVGIHQDCRGWLDRKSPSRAYDALICRECHLRVVIPRGIKTYGDLRAHMVKELAPPSPEPRQPFHGPFR